MSVVTEPTREAGLARLARFLPNAGSAYTRTRNFDFGPDRRGNTSVLSPYIRHRLVLETEVLEQTLRQHSLSAAGKFVDEVFWRTYFKGFLEQHPSIWSAYREALPGLLRQLENDATLLERYNSATAGNTGIDCFDAWVKELTDTGYLHNHARMWFASIWVFTLELPWQLGADFFLRHLMDGDPASNTLSWRWVCGLHTRGKTYLARVSNIASYTNNRYNPVGQLADRASPLEESRVYPLERLRPPGTLAGEGRFGLLLTEDDAAPDIDMLDRAPESVLGIVTTRGRSPLPVGVPAFDFASGAVHDGVRRAAQAFDVSGSVYEALDHAEAIISWANDYRLDTLVTPHVPVGPAADALRASNKALREAGIKVVQLRRPFDSTSWPHATHGYFRLKRAIPSILENLGLRASDGDASKAS